MMNDLAEANCHICGIEVSTHPDAPYSLSYCGDCARPTCEDHRDNTSGEICSLCQQNWCAGSADTSFRRRKTIAVSSAGAVAPS